MHHLFACFLLLGLARTTMAQTLTFQAATQPSNAGVAYDLVVADFNSDGRPDIATANQTGIEVLLSTGAGNFQLAAYSHNASQPNLSVARLRCADINGDGKPDILANFSAGGNIRLLVNVGSGTFPGVVNLSLSNSPVGWEFIAADFNRDGLADVVGPNGSFGAGLGPVMTLFHSSVSTATSGQLTGASSAPYLAGVADLNKTLAYDVNADGFLDLITTALCIPVRRPCPTGPYRSLFLNTPTGLVPASNLPDGGSSFALAQLNGDALPDLIEAASNGFQITYQAANGTFANPQAVPFPSANSRSVSLPRVADFDQDGRPDLAGLCLGSTPQNSVVTIQRNLGNGQFEATPLVLPIGASNRTAMEVADFNQDGRPDIAVIDGGTVKVFWNSTVLATRAATLAQVRLYPNPAQGQLRLQASGAAFPLQLTLLNALGQVVVTHTFGAAEGSVDVARLPAGWYNARLRDAHGRSKSVPVQLQ